MLLLLLFEMALAWFLQKKLYQKNWQKNLKIQVSFQDSAIYEGEESTLKEVIVNDKLLPIPALELGISMSRNQNSTARQKQTQVSPTRATNAMSFRSCFISRSREHCRFRRKNEDSTRSPVRMP